MTQKDPFIRQLDTLHRRVAELKEKIATGNSADLLVYSLAELDTALEELRVAEEELQVQAEHLVASRILEEAQNRHYQAMFEFAPDAYLVTDRNGKIQEANQATQRLLHLGGKRLSGKLLITFVAPEDRAAFREWLLRLARTPEIFEWDVQIILRNRERFHASLRAGAEFDSQGNPVAIRWLLRDITLRQEALRRSEERYQLLVEGIQDYAILALDMQGLITAWNPAAERIMGYREAEVIGRASALVFVPEDRERGVDKREMATAAQQGKAMDERWHQRKDGSHFWGSGTLSALRDQSGNLYGFVKIMRDNTEKQAAEQTLRRSEEKLRLVLDAAQMGHWERNLQTGELLWSREHNRILGLPPDASLERWEQFLERIHPDDRALVSASIEKAAASREDFAAEFRLVSEKETCWVETIGRAYYQDDRSPARILGVVHDITERKQKEAEHLQDMARMADQEQQAAILQERNRMAQEIHDSLAQGFSGIFIQLEAAEDALAISQQALQEHIVRARELARSSLAEARRSVHALRPFALDQRSLSEALRHVVEQTTHGTAVRVETKIEGEPFALTEAVENHLLRIGQEMLANALKHSRASQISLALAFRRSQVGLTVRDNGIGLSHLPARDPEDSASASGLGIRGIQERVRLLGGKVHFWSRPQKGTCIEVQVPVTPRSNRKDKNG